MGDRRLNAAVKRLLIAQHAPLTTDYSRIAPFVFAEDSGGLCDRFEM
jgi:hypothetical protein